MYPVILLRIYNIIYILFITNIVLLVRSIWREIPQFIKNVLLIPLHKYFAHICLRIAPVFVPIYAISPVHIT